MYAIVVSGGKQHRVKEGDLVQVEKIEGVVGTSVELKEVLMIGGDAPRIGTPKIDGASVKAEIVKHGLAKKVLVFHRRRRTGYKKLRGHRQPFTHLRITKIEVR